MDDYIVTDGSGRIVRHNSLRAERHGSPSREVHQRARSPTKEAHARTQSPPRETFTNVMSPTRETFANVRSPTRETYAQVRSPTREIRTKTRSPTRRVFHTNTNIQELNKMDRIEPRTPHRVAKPEHMTTRRDERSHKELLDDIKNLKRQTNAEIHTLKLQLKTSEQKYTQLLKKCNLQLRDLDKARAENTKLGEKIRLLNEQCRELRQAKASMNRQLDKHARQSRSMSLDRGTSSRPLTKRHSRSSTSIDRKGIHQRCISKEDFSNLLHKCDRLVDDYDTLKSQLSSHDNVLHQIHRTVSHDNIRLERNFEGSESGISPNFDQEVRRLEMVLRDKNKEIKALKSHLEEQMQLSDEQWKLMQMKEEEMEKERAQWRNKLAETEAEFLQMEEAMKRERETHHAELKETETAAKKNNDILRTRLDEMIDELRRISKQESIDKHTIAMLKEENERLREVAHQMRVQLNYSAVSSPLSFRSPIPQKRWVIPLALYDDDILLSALDQLLLRLDIGVYLQPLKSKEITAQYDGQIVVPVLGESVVANGIQHALKKAKLGNVSANIILFHQLAPHNCRIYTPSRSRVSVRDIVGRYNAIVDVVFWNGAVYDCETNANAVQELNEVIKRF